MPIRPRSRNNCQYKNLRFGTMPRPEDKMDVTAERLSADESGFCGDSHIVYINVNNPS